ncbi:MAG TPA: ABC transporter permease [Streptosporangiaceae bacterium]|jgi:teichoic acid transport system permease protein
MSREGPDDPGQQSRAGTLSGPGALTDAPVTGSEYQPDEASGSSGESLAALARQYGLKPSAARPPLVDYIKRIWQRRYFVTGFATAQNVAMYTEARLGQIWQVLTPLLNVAVYFLIFGVILDTKRGVPNFLAFLVIGVFVFNFTQRTFITSSRVMIDSLPLIRALYFPRACLPFGYVLIELQQLVISFVVLFAIVLATGEPLSWYWLLIIPILIMQTLFNAGASFILARFGAGFDDVSQLLPFIVRTWFYASGVMFSIQTYSNLAKHPTLAKILQYNPASIYITLTREALMRSQRMSAPGARPFNQAKCNFYYHPGQAHGIPVSSLQYYSAYCHEVVSQANLWLFGAAWAVVILLVGFVFFWRAEVRYGRG